MTVLNYQGIAPLGVIYAFLMFSPPGPGLLAISNNQGHPTGAPNDNFRKMSVRKTI